MIEHSAPAELYDAPRFSAELARQDATEVFRQALNHAADHFNQRFHQGEYVHTLVNEQAMFMDLVLQQAWQQFSWDRHICLVAVGGYGRGELHPHSDVDLLILIRHSRPERYRDSIEKFLAFLWDIQLKVGQSVRSLAQCVSEARNDITVVTNLMETRLITGDAKLLDKLRAKTSPKKIWPSALFYTGKLAEQQERHKKHGNTEYNLEPNVKEAPGGLRDIQLLNWVAKRHFNVNRRSQLITAGFLTEEEYITLRRDEEFLWKVRYGLHLIAGRAEERLLFDYQRALAEQFGFFDSDDRLGVEKFMQRYYQVVLSIRELNDVLLQYLDEMIYKKDKVRQEVILNERFVVRDGFIDTVDDYLFGRNPPALLELFALLGENEQIEGIRAATIRQLRLHRGLIDESFRNNPHNKALFLRILRSPWMLSLQLKRMSRYGILGSYLPEFGRIMGQTQHDLFHIYPVDVHTLQLITNIRRLTRPEVAEKFPISSHIYKSLPKPELLIIAALYHDIAKGRGGDHSKLGMVDTEDFGRRHGLTEQEIALTCWLVENHLLMSTVSQREDISDPDVIYKFATTVGDRRRLEFLYVLTVADINATNPKLWTDWKGSLMRDLYFETKRALRRGLEQRADRVEWVADSKQAVKELLAERGIDADAARAIWRDVGDEFFLREKAGHIADFTAAMLAQPDPNQPVVLLRDVGDEVPIATQVFIHSRDHNNIFAIAAATFDQLAITIQDARLQTSDDNRAFDVFYLLDDNGRPFASNERLSNKVQSALARAIASPEQARFDVNRRTSRQLKQFSWKTLVTLSNDIESNTTVIEVVTPDRPGLLAHLARIFLHFRLRVHNARIATLGERVEDIFYLTDEDYQPLVDLELCEKLRATICSELDGRNRQDAEALHAPIETVNLEERH